MKESFEKSRFIKEHADEIQALIPKEERSAFRSGVYTPEMITEALEKYENKLFVHKNQTATEGAERVFLTTSDPGSYNNAARSLVETLLADARCKELDVVTGGVADEKFQTTFGNDFTRIKDSDSFLEDLDAVLDEGPVDVALGTGTTINGPESLVTYNGKQLLGAKKVFFIMESWGTLKGSFNEDLLRRDRETGEVASMIDGFFCIDELAKAIIHQTLPSYPQDRIFVTGTPALDLLENDKADEYRAKTREKLGIGGDAFVALYLGDGPGDYPGADPHINEKTLISSYKALNEAARAHPERRFVLLYRPHPRNPELPSELRDLGGESSSVRILLGSAPFSMNEAAAASDIVMSLASTENLLAPLRGKRSAFLAYEGKGLGADVLERAYGADIVQAMGQVEGVSMARTAGDITHAVDDMLSGYAKAVAPYTGNASKKILDVIFTTQPQSAV